MVQQSTLPKLNLGGEAGGKRLPNMVEHMTLPNLDLGVGEERVELDGRSTIV